MAILTRQIPLTAAQGSFTGTYRTSNHVQLTDTRMVIVHNITGVSPDFYTRMFTIIDMEDGLDSNQPSPNIVKTVGRVDKEAFEGNGVSIARLSDTRFVVSEPRTAAGNVKTEIFDITGTTITRAVSQSTASFIGATNNQTNATHVLIPLSDTLFIQTHNNESNGVNYPSYIVFRFTPSPAAISYVRHFNDTSAGYQSDISWQKIPGTNNVLVVNRYVTRYFYAFQTFCWVFSDQGTAVRTSFAVDGEPAFLGPDRMVVSKWGHQGYQKLNGESDGRSFSKNYDGVPEDDNTYRPIVVPIDNDHHLQMRREFFQEQDSAMFMKVVRRDDTNFHSTSAWSTEKWYGNVIYSSLNTSKLTLPIDKRAPQMSGRKRLWWAGVFSSGYRIQVIEPTANVPQNPPAAPLPGPPRAAVTRFTFENGIPSKVSVVGTPTRIINYDDPTLGTTKALATNFHADNVSYTTFVTFNIPAGLTEAVIRYVGESEQGFDGYLLELGGRTIVSRSGNTDGIQQAIIPVSGSSSVILKMTYNTDHSRQVGFGGVAVTMVEFRPS